LAIPGDDGREMPPPPVPGLVLPSAQNMRNDLVKLPAAAKQTLRAGYEVRIAGKNELVGGNRREP